MTTVTQLERISTPEWQHDLLEKISSLRDFTALAETARTTQPISLSHKQLDSLNHAAREIIAGYDRSDLACARQHYNNEHLLEFWRFYNGELEHLITDGHVDSDFPLFHVEIDHARMNYTTASIERQFFARHEPFSDESNPPQTVTPELPALPNDPRMRILFRKLTALNQIGFRSFLALYNIFIRRARADGLKTWHYFLIHFFLDNNLYGNGQGRYYKAHFEAIFFNTTIFELKCFLLHQHSCNRAMTVTDVSRFLKRQRDYMVRRALEITLEENEISNRRKDLLAYDESEGVVKQHGITDQLRQYYGQTIVQPFGLIKQNGCPFARSKGLSKNAVVEVFGFIDDLMCKLLSFSPEFSDCFDAASGRQHVSERCTERNSGY